MNLIGPFHSIFHLKILKKKNARINKYNLFHEFKPGCISNFQGETLFSVFLSYKLAESCPSNYFQK